MNDLVSHPILVHRLHTGSSMREHELLCNNIIYISTFSLSYSMLVHPDGYIGGITSRGHVELNHFRSSNRGLTFGKSSPMRIIPRAMINSLPARLD